ncbi:MAG: type II secretion system minor pseudopilin GspI [Pseudomonadota bacterium]|nr:type II secretion system minor pseudopilin GspI [Pseudomonadota bacterium]
MKTAQRPRGFTLVEVLVALVIVALGLTALMVAVNGTARTSGFLRDKTLSQWIALNRLSEVRLNLVKFGQNTDTGELEFGNRKWHYDTRYFDTSIASMKRVVVRVYLGDAKTKGNPIAQAVGFLSTSLAAPGSQVKDWTAGIVTATVGGTPGPGEGGRTGNPITPTPVQPIPAPPVIR